MEAGAASLPRACPLPVARRFNVTKSLSYGFTLVAVGTLVFMVVLFLWQSVPVWRSRCWSHPEPRSPSH